MYKIPKVNLKWDSLYVYYLHSFKHLCGLFLSTDLKIELFLRWEICCLSMHHDTSIEGRETIAWHFLAANRSPLLWYTVVFLYYYTILLYYYLYSEMNKGKSEALQNKRKRKSSNLPPNLPFIASPPSPRPLANKMSTIQPNNSRYFSVQFSLGKFWLKFSSLGCLWQSFSHFLYVFVVYPRVLSWLRWSRFTYNTVVFWERFTNY